jgi:hypothetical protein
MADNFTFPGGGQNSYVPVLHESLIIEYSRNPAAFPVNQYINTRKVDFMRGYYIKMRNDGQGRYVNKTDVIWPDANDAPELTYGNDQYDFPGYQCVRYGYTKRLGYLGVEQAGWDILDQAARYLAQDAMTHRSRRIHTTLTTSANWPSTNVGNASTVGGGIWSNATSTSPFIRQSIMQMGITIQQQTYSAVQLKDLYLVVNPDTAKLIATSQEFIDFLKQNPVALSIWQGQAQFTKYNLPTELFGVNVVVDDTVYNSALPGQTPVFSFSFPDNTALLLTKQQAVKPAAGGAFSTFELFVYKDMEPFVFNDAKNRRYDLQVEENVDDSPNALVAPQSGYLLTTNA